jgi:hypothetical protein
VRRSNAFKNAFKLARREDIMRTPYYHKQRATWFVWIGQRQVRRQINLGQDKEANWTKYHQLMLDQQDPENSPAVPVVKLLDQFLCSVERRRKPGLPSPGRIGVLISEG